MAALEANLGEKAALGDLVVIAYHSNPMIRAARAEWSGVVEKYRVDTAWADPELMAEGMYPAETLGDTAKPMDWKFSLAQAIPLWGRQGAAGKVSGAEAKIARLKLDAAVRDVVLQVRQSAAELRYLEQAVEIVQGQQFLVGKLTAAGAAAYTADRASLYEVMKARAQSGQLEYDGLLIDESARTERARLNALLDRPPDAPLGPVAAEAARPLAYGIGEIDALAEANAEDVRIARAELERSEAMAALTQYETLPGFALEISYGNVNDVNQVGAKATVMLPLRLGKNAGRIGAARADTDKMRAMYGAKVNDTRTAVRDLAFRLKNAERLANLYRDDLVPQAARAVETAQTRLSQGLGSLGDAAEAQSAWYGFRLALARAEADRTVLLASARSTRRTQPDRARRRGRPAGGCAMKRRIALLLAVLTLAITPACASKYQIAQEGGGFLRSGPALSRAGRRGDGRGGPPGAARGDGRIRRGFPEAAGSGRPVGVDASPPGGSGLVYRARRRPPARPRRRRRRPRRCGQSPRRRFLPADAGDADAAAQPDDQVEGGRGAGGGRGLRAGGADRRGAAQLFSPHRDLDGGRRDGRPAGFPLPRSPRAQGADRRRGGARGPRTARGGAARRGRRGAHGRTGS